MVLIKYPKKFNKIRFIRSCDQINKVMDFANFDNETGTPDGCYIVPNFIHFIRFKPNPIPYIHMITYLSALKHQKPEKIYFHYDNNETFSGKYWEILKNSSGFMDVVEFNYVEMPTEIFGQELSDGWRAYHGSDITRIRVLMQYGGIYLDNDAYVSRGFNDLRRYEIAIAWSDDENIIGNQVIVAHKDARFLKEWLESYRGAYDKGQWYYNAGMRPTELIISKNPELIHKVKYLFGTNTNLIYKIFKEYWPMWRYLYAIHVLHGHFGLLGEYRHELPDQFDEYNIKNYSITYREMALDVYNPDNDHFTYG